MTPGKNKRGRPLEEKQTNPPDIWFKVIDESDRNEFRGSTMTKIKREGILDVDHFRKMVHSHMSATCQQRICAKSFLG